MEAKTGNLAAAVLIAAMLALGGMTPASAYAGSDRIFGDAAGSEGVHLRKPLIEYLDR